jgi:thiamine biosynthesis lipoprotein
MFTDLSRSVVTGETMGTQYSVTLYAQKDIDIQAIEVALFTTIDLVDQQMSTWKPNSDLMRLNGAAIGDWVSIPTELMQVLVAALEIGRATNGAFDITLGDLVNAWGFGAKNKTPDISEIKNRLGQIQTPAFDALELDINLKRARKLKPVQLDLSGIAKGFGVDQMLSCLKGFGIKNALVSLDGELKACGQIPENEPWAIALEKPDYQIRAPMGIVTLDNVAIATSGDYRHWVDVGETRLSHTMDRHSGGPLKNCLASVSVIAENCMEADAWATALMVMGEVAGPALARANGMEALFILREQNDLKQVPVGEAFGGT